MASRVGVPLGRGATPIGPHQCVFLLFHGTHQILEHLCITMYHLATLSHLCLLLVGTLGRSAGAETAPSATGRVWEQVDPDAELSVVSLSTQELGVHNFGKARLEFPHIMFNDAMGDVSRGFREYARIDKRIARRKPQAVALTYELTFSPDYEWSANGRLGGLLPGIAGGKSRRQWRVQLAWDPEGRIKVSKNLPRENRGGGKAVIETPPDAFWKPSPEKNHVRVIVKQNSKRKRNGTLDVSVNGRQLATLANVVFDWRGRGRSKFVLREGRYLGPNPTRGREEVRFLSTTNLKVSGVDVKIELPDVWWVDDSETPLPAPSAPVSTPETPPVSQEPEDAVVGDPVPSPVSDPVPSPVSDPVPPPSPVPSRPGTNPKLVTLTWSTRGLSTDAISPRRFDADALELHLCSKDILQFSWADEPGRGLGVYGFFNLEDWKSCAKTPDTELNYMKNQRPSGLFKTKPNRGGWRWYASFEGADDGHCKYSCQDDKGISGGCNAKVAVNWDMTC